MAAKAHINATLLRWAREQAGLLQAEAAQRAGIGQTRRKTPAERLNDFESARELPSPTQLKALARVYRRPAITFYLRGPPAPDTVIPDFRTLADRPSGEHGALLNTLLRRMRARQQEIREILLEDEESREPLPFLGRFSADAQLAEIVADIRTTLGLSVRLRHESRDQDDFFRVLRRKAEAVGIFVQLAGDLGSWHTAIAPEEFRGFALVDNIAPFIVINANDAKAAHPFTLLHELAHLWFGESGISNFSPFQSGSGTRRLELICNRVAAELLLPGDALATEWRTASRTNPAETIANLAKDWRVSRAVVARRLKDLGEITEETWWALYAAYQDEWKRRSERLREHEGGPGYYITVRSRLGSSLIQTVLGAIDAGELTHTRASRILGVHAKAFDGLREA
jgi:Zn-dependent peptidase ImmA (M78 family)/transcriptional regulator with XRE-family HTH domain